jgi:hypothetical protein
MVFILAVVYCFLPKASSGAKRIWKMGVGVGLNPRGRFGKEFLRVGKIWQVFGWQTCKHRKNSDSKLCCLCLYRAITSEATCQARRVVMVGFRM